MNDYSGLKENNGLVTKKNSLRFRAKYHQFIKAIRKIYPQVKIVAVAAFPDWIKKNVKRVVDEEMKKGAKDVFYAYFNEFPGGYVANGHPTIETHKKMAEELLKELDTLKLFY